MRPKDENGRTLPAAHRRLPYAPKLEEAAIFAISGGGRSAHLSLNQKFTLVRAAIDHVVDGGVVPKRVGAADKDRPDNHNSMELWNTAVRAVRAAMPIVRSAA